MLERVGRQVCRAFGTETGITQRCILETPVWTFTPVVTRNSFTGADKVYIACGYTDLRKGIDGLARLVQQQFALDPFANTLFLFCLPCFVV